MEYNTLRNLLLFISNLILVSSSYAAIFSLHSTGFNEGEKLNPVYTCDGKDISPELKWDHAPLKTVSFALILSDPDAPNGTFYHWALFNIPRTVNTISENSVVPFAKIAKNSWGQSQYNGPCPPKGSEHRYIFSLYALDTMLKLDSDADALSLLNAIQNHVLGVAEVKTKYAR